MSKAADSISDGDMVERMIRGGQQHWSLMPVHGMLSTVLPSYHCYGGGGYANPYGNGGGEMGSARQFPAWFGKNSTQGRLARSLTDIQIKMRLKVSGDKREIRQSYIPTLFHKLVLPLVEEGAEAINDIISAMDDYYLTKDEWDALVEMGVGELTCEPLLKKIKPATKTAFTRQYNKADHPIPFHKGTDIAPMKKGSGGGAESKPDLEEAFEQEPENFEDEDDPDSAKNKKAKKEEEEGTIKDKLVKAKKAPVARKKAVKKEADDSEEDVKPKKKPASKKK